MLNPGDFCTYLHLELHKRRMPHFVSAGSATLKLEDALEDAQINS